MRLKKKDIIIPLFHFNTNNNFLNNLNDLEIEIFKHKLVSLKKFLKLKNYRNIKLFQ